MTRSAETLQVGWRPGPVQSVAACAGILLAAAVAIHVAGLFAGLAVLACGGMLALATWHEAWLDGPSVRLRGARTFGRRVALHARVVDRLEYRRGAALPRLSLHRRADGVVLRATGPDPRAEAFRQAAMWLLVHGRRQSRIDPALLDALAAMPDHARTGQPHDASHA